MTGMLLTSVGHFTLLFLPIQQWNALLRETAIAIAQKLASEHHVKPFDFSWY